MSGLIGRVEDVYYGYEEEIIYEIELDSISLKKLPATYIEEMVRLEEDFQNFELSENQLKKLRKIKPEIATPVGNTNKIDPNLAIGSRVNHTRFGRGKVINLEGVGSDRKAEIQFDKGDIKKLLLRFAKLEVL